DGPANDIESLERPDWMNHLEAWECQVVCHNRELKAYQHLTEAQDQGLVPRFFGPTCIVIDEDGHPSLSRMEGLLIEYIEGRRMSSLRPGVNISVDEAEIVSQHVLELGRRLRRYGVSHNDIHVGNIILRHSDNLPVLFDWGHASCDVAELPLHKRWTHPSMKRNYDVNIRLLLRQGIYYEGPEEDSVYPEMTAGGVWHRYPTPLSDRDQYLRAKEEPWSWINYAIESLSQEEKEKLYEEDVNVDPEKGLRWKVKKGTKTGSWDGLVP
ncbi:hypothetical protein H0H93_016596, partial [Arthromyces matolae]